MSGGSRFATCTVCCMSSTPLKRRRLAAVLAALSGAVAISSSGVARAAPPAEYTYRLLYELSNSEFSNGSNRLCGIAFNNHGHAAWIRNGIVNPGGSRDNNVRQLWFHDGTQARLLWSSSAASYVAGEDEFYPDCSGTANTAGSSAVALNDADLVVVQVAVRGGAPSNQPGQNPPEFYWIDAAQDPAPVLRSGQAGTGPNSNYGKGINLNSSGQIGLGRASNPGTVNNAWVLTATDGIASATGSFTPLDSAFSNATLTNDAGWVVSWFGRGTTCPAGAGCTAILSVLDPTRNDAARQREIPIGPGSEWTGDSTEKAMGLNNRGLTSVRGGGNQAACYPQRMSVFDVGLVPKEYLIAGVGTTIPMQEPGSCSGGGWSGSTMNDWNQLVFFADTRVDGLNNSQIWLADISGSAFRRAIPIFDSVDPSSVIDVGGGRRIRVTSNQWIGAESLNEAGQVAINTWFVNDASPTGTRQGILVATPCAGCSPGKAAQPLESLPGAGWRFDGCRWTVEGGPVTPGQAVQCGAWQNPPLAFGYDYAVEGDGPAFATLMVPVPLPDGDDSFTVEFGGNSHPLAAGQVFRFTDHVPAGVRAFRISGIDTLPAMADSVVVRLTHLASNDVDFTITAVPVAQNDTPIASFTLSSALVAGCRNVSGTVTLSEPAPAIGATATINDTLDAALPPETVRFAAGEVTRRFTIKTRAVAADVAGEVSVTLGPQTATRPLTLRRIGVSSLSVTPTQIVGGAGAAGVARLECAAGPGPITVALSSTNPAAAAPTVASIQIPAGANSGAFAVQTAPVLATTSVRIAGTANGLTRTRTVRVLPAAAVSPTRLSFGNVPVNTSRALSTTLTNRGSAPITVTGISLSGSGASINVTFAPTAAVSRSARLSVATTATATAIAVTLSGSGVVP